MKKTLAMILAVILVMSLAACGDRSGGESKEPSDVTGNSITEDAQQGEQSEKPGEPAKTEVTIGEAVLVDEAGVKITAKSLAADGSFGPEIKLLIENNSGRDLTFQCRSASVNGYMVKTVMSVDVANGKKANDSLTFLASAFEACGIEAIADVEIAFHIFDMARWETYLDTDMIRIKTSIADTFEYTYDDSGDLAYEGNGVKIVVKGLAEEESVFGPGIVVYIENTGDKDVAVQTIDVSVNGVMVDALFYCEVAAGKRAVDTVVFKGSTLEENGITAIEDAELSFFIFDMAERNRIASTGAVKITF